MIRLSSLVSAVVLIVIQICSITAFAGAFAFSKTIQHRFQSVGGYIQAFAPFAAGRALTASGIDGGYSQSRGVAYDAGRDVFYLSDSTRIIKMASNGTFIGAVGKVTTTTGTCSVGDATSWCTGGGFAAGTADGEYSTAQGIAYDGTNDVIYVVDPSGYRVDKISAATGAFIGAIGVTSASTGTCPASGAANVWCTGGTFVSSGSDVGFSTFNRGITYSAANDAIYLASTDFITKRTATTGAYIGSVGKTTSSTGTCPASGIATTWCTGGTFTFDYVDGSYFFATGLRYDPTAHVVYVVDSAYGRVSKFDAGTGTTLGAIGLTTATTGTCPAAGVTSGWCTGGKFASGTSDGSYTVQAGYGDMEVDATNNAIYITDTLNQRISKVTASTGAFVGNIGYTSASSGTCPATGLTSTWCTGGTFGSQSGDGFVANPFGLAYSAANNSLIIAAGAAVFKVTATTGAFVGSVGAQSGISPTWTTNAIPLAGAGDGKYSAARQVAYDGSRNVLYVADVGSFRLNKIDAATGTLIGAIGKVTASTGTCSVGTATGWCTGGTFQSGSLDGQIGNVGGGVAYDAGRDLIYVSDNLRIMKFDAGTGAFIGAVGALSATTGTCPASGAATTWCTGGTFTFSGNDSAYFGVVQLVYDSVNDIIYASDGNHFRIVKLTAATGAFVGAIGRVTATAGTCPASGATAGWCTGGTFATGNIDGGFSNTSGLAFDSTTNSLLVGDRNARLSKFVATTGVFVGSMGAITASTGTCPSTGVATSWCTGGTFTGGTTDGGFSGFGSFAMNSDTHVLYLGQGNKISQIDPATGALLGSVGNTTSSTGSCLTKGQVGQWCKGGTFGTASNDGGFNSVGGLAYDSIHKMLFIVEISGGRIQRMTNP